MYWKGLPDPRKATCGSFSNRRPMPNGRQTEIVCPCCLQWRDLEVINPVVVSFYLPGKMQFTCICSECGCSGGLTLFDEVSSGGWIFRLN